MGIYGDDPEDKYFELKIPDLDDVSSFCDTCAEPDDDCACEQREDSYV